MPSVVKAMSLAQLHEELQPLEEMERFTFDPRSGAGQFAMEGGRLYFDYTNGTQKRFRPTAQAYLKLGQVLGVPGAYIQKTPHYLMIPHMNFWLTNAPVQQMTVALSGDEAVAFSKGAAAPVSNSMLIDVLSETSGSDLLVHHVSSDIFRTTYSLTVDATHDLGTAVRRGDIVRTGITVDNSYAMTGPTAISAYIHRLVCTNGAVSVDHTYKMSRRGGGGDEDSTRAWAQDAIAQVLASLDTEVGRLRALQSIRLDEHLSKSLGSVFAEFNVPQGVRDRITDVVIDTRAETLYDLYNAITYIASNEEEVIDNPALVARLMRIGGSLASHPEFCDSCYRMIV